MKIHWERCNATAYSLQTSDDGNSWSDLAGFSAAPSDFRQTIELDNAVTTRYLRINVTSFNPTAPTEDGGDTTWNSVGVCEFETYSYAGILETQDVMTAEDVANDLTVQHEIASGGTFTMPSVPDGFEIRFLGADYEQVLDSDLTVYQPLTDKDIKVNFTVQEVNDPDSAVDSKEYTVTVKGQYTAQEGDNAKPAVIPELAEWKGAQGGDFTVADGTRILLHPDVADELAYMAEEFKADYEEIMGGTIEIATGSNPQAGDFYFMGSDGSKGLEADGYYMDIDDYITIESEEAAGAYWSTRTILQILTQTDGTIPKGETRDYPKYEVRGFMIDVARRPFSWDIVDETAKTMAWYKMNDLQIHLNDNYIPLENYTNRGDDPMTAYEGFRMESNVKEGGNNGLNQTDLTSEDLYYTKDDMRSFIQNYRKLGIDIVPEFDTPAYSLSFTKVRPDLRLGTSGRQNDHLNLTTDAAYNASLEFVKSIWDEYLTGDNPVFDQDTIVNVGTDEYGDYNEQFRQYTDDLISYVQDTGRTVRLWGSLSMKSGNTEVTSDGVQMNIWNDSWADPQEMYEEGFDLIDMNDGTVYIVPAAGYYYDYLNSTYLYNTYDPATRMGVPAGSEQVLGGAYAIWNDMIDNSANGLTETEIYDRFNSAAPYYASSLWGEGADRNYNGTSELSAEIGEAPRTNAYDKVESSGDTVMTYDFEDGYTDSSGNKYDAAAGANAAVTDGALVLSGGESYADTPLDRIGVGHTLSFDIELTSPAKPGQILFESDAEYGTYDIRIMQDGTLGFTRECYDYSFGYKLPVDEKVSLKIETKDGKTTLYAENMSFPATGSFTYEGDLKASGISRSSLALPLGRIGSATNAVNAMIDNVKVETGEATDYTYVENNLITPGTTSDFDYDGSIANAFDNNPSTIWHSDYAGEQDTPPFTVTMELASAQDINGFYYLPRQTGTNGNITQYSLYYYDENGDRQPLIEHGTWKSDSSEKIVYFSPVNTAKLELIVEAGQGDFGSAAEFKILAGTKDMTEVTIYACAWTEGNGTVSTNLDEVRIAPGTGVTFTAVPDRGYNFAGWYDSITDTLVSTLAEYTVPAVNETTVLVAKFDERNSHTVTINGTPQSVYDGDKAVKPATDPTKPGHEFLGWFEEDAQTAFDFDTPITENVTLTARFDPYEVTLGLAPGSAQDSGTVSTGTMNENGEVTVKAAATQGYTFRGWEKDGKIVSYEATYTFIPTEDTALAAVFAKQAEEPEEPDAGDMGDQGGNPQKPGAGRDDGEKAVQTGNETDFMPWMICFIVSAGVVIAFGKKRINK